MSMLSLWIFVYVCVFQCFSSFSLLCSSIGQVLFGHIKIMSVTVLFLMKNMLGRKKKKKTAAQGAERNRGNGRRGEGWTRKAPGCFARSTRVVPVWCVRVPALPGLQPAAAAAARLASARRPAIIQPARPRGGAVVSPCFSACVGSTEYEYKTNGRQSRHHRQ